MNNLTSPRALASLPAPAAAELITESSVLIQPFGAIEQHGPHLPLATDLLIATAVAEAVVEERGDELDLWILPPLAYTKSNEHDWAPGTISVSADTLLHQVMDLGRSLAQLPARRLVLFNGHGGNSALLTVAARELRIEHGFLTFITHPYIPADQGGPSPSEELGMGIHASLDETSIVLHLQPDLVKMDLAARNVPEWLAGNRYVRFGGQVGFGWSSRDFGPSGVIGDPTNASAERGKELFEGVVAVIGDAMAEVAAFAFPEATS
jgi:creatinine amidohydrolase